MAESTGKTTAGKNKESRPKALKFQRAGKYFLFALLLAVQSLIAYTIIEKNYVSVYAYANSFYPEKTGMYNMEQIVINPANTNGHRYLLVELSLELESREDEKLIEARKSKIRNDLIEYLSSLSVHELQGTDTKENLRFELIRIINNAIERRSVCNLYYSKYVMQ